MEEKFNILWLDDDFSPTSTAGFKEQVEEKEAEWSNWNIQKVTNKADFEEKFSNPEKHWDAVILDIYGMMSSEDEDPNSTTFKKALEVVENKCHVIVGFSGEYFAENRKSEKGLIGDIANEKGVKIIRKKDGLHNLHNEVSKMINPPFRRDFPEYRIVEKYLDYDKYGNVYKKIQDLYNINVNKFSGFTEGDFDKLRKFPDWIFNIEALEKGYLNENIIKKDKDKDKDLTLGDCLRSLADIAGKKHKMPYVKAALLSLNNLTNVDNHPDATGKAYEYGKYRFNAFFNALFISLKWYYEEFVPSFHEATIPTLRENAALAENSESNTEDGIIYHDEKLDILHVGNIQLPKPKEKQIVGWKLDVDFTLGEIEVNRYNKDKYPWFAKYKQRPMKKE